MIMSVCLLKILIQYILTELKFAISNIQSDVSLPRLTTINDPFSSSIKICFTISFPFLPV